MDLAWHPLGAVGLLTGVGVCALAAVVWGAPAARASNRLLGAYLFLQGLYFLSYNGLRLFVVDPREAYALMIVGHGFTNALSNGVLLVFVSSFDSPLVSWMRRSGLAWVAAVPFATVAVHHLFRPEAWVVGVEPFAGFEGWSAVGTPLRSLYFLGLTAFVLVCAAPAVDAWRRAKTPLARRQAGILAVTFAVTNASWVLFLLWFVAFGTGALTPGMVVLNFLWQAMTSLGFAAGLVYGITKAQLFDVDLKIKWTLSKSTVAAAFVGVFFVVSEGAETILSARMGPVAGLLAAGTLMFAIAPLQRAADRVADRAMPRVEDTAEYRTVRKREVYRAAVESALAEGDISQKERGMLATFASELGLTPREMHDVEREARAARAEVAA